MPIQKQMLLLSAFAAVALPGAQSSHAAESSVTVMYAGSLVNLMQHGIAKAFDTASGDHVQGYAAGSNELAGDIKGKTRHADVFISANPELNKTMMGSANGDWETWYVTFAESPLVIGYNPNSRFAADLKTKPWYEVLQEPGIRIGRTDPKLDPKGRLTVELLNKAAKVYNLPGLEHKVLGSPNNPAQVFPEEDLAARLQSGKLDVGFFYSTETADLKITAIALPAETAFSAHYTATILQNAPNPTGADHFLAYLLGPDGRAQMEQHGLHVLTPTFSGDSKDVPASIRAALLAAK